MSLQSPPFLSIILPAYNEGENIYANILRVCETLREYEYEFELTPYDLSDYKDNDYVLIWHFIGGAPSRCFCQKTGLCPNCNSSFVCVF